MLPSLLARDIQQGIKQFLITGFEPADGFFHGVMRRFVDNEPAWMKGPIPAGGPALPARQRRPGFFQQLPDRTPRLHAPARGMAAPGERQAGGRHTLVVTGTGSGKTECFLYPVSSTARAYGRLATRHQGARHLPDECAGQRPGAALCRGHRLDAGVHRAASGAVRWWPPWRPDAPWMTPRLV